MFLVKTRKGPTQQLLLGRTGGLLPQKLGSIGLSGTTARLQQGSPPPCHSRPPQCCPNHSYNSRLPNAE